MKKSLTYLVLAAAVSGCSSYGGQIPDHPIRKDAQACFQQAENNEKLQLIEIPVASNALSNAIFAGLASQSNTAAKLKSALEGGDPGHPVLVYGANEGNNVAMLKAALTALPKRAGGGEICLAAPPELGSDLSRLSMSRGFNLLFTREAN